jgi:mitotic spindle assembly checkpoint protein MAD1
MNDEQQSNGIHVTRFTLQSVYAQSDDEKLEFVYESGSTNIVVGLFHCRMIFCIFLGYIL